MHSVTKPILHSSCAQATSKAEARFRIDAPITGHRKARVIALDDGAATIVRRLATKTWQGGRFYTLESNCVRTSPAADKEMMLHRTSGTASPLAVELANADVTVLVATGHADATAARSIGTASAQRGIMTAGIVLGEQARTRDAVLTLRPLTRVLIVSQEPHDVEELLTSIRA